VQMVVHELGGERIDILPWNQVPKTFIASALSPAKIVSVSVDEADKSARVVVPNDQLSLAIGRKGQNVRLAAKLTGWNIDIKSQSEAEVAAKDKIAKSIFKSVPVTDLEGVGSKTAERLQDAGFSSVEDIADTNVENLAEVPGIGAKTAEKLHSKALKKIKEVEDDKD